MTKKKVNSALTDAEENEQAIQELEAQIVDAKSELEEIRENTTVVKTDYEVKVDEIDDLIRQRDAMLPAGGGDSANRDYLRKMESEYNDRAEQVLSANGKSANRNTTDFTRVPARTHQSDPSNPDDLLPIGTARKVTVDSKKKVEEKEIELKK